jgi:hypothetical protein
MRMLLIITLMISFTAIGCRTQSPPQTYSPPLPVRGIITAPANPASVAGRYYRSLGCSSIYLTLGEDGTYFAEFGGLARGESLRGQWHLEGSRIRFDLPPEKTMMTVSLQYFSPLEVLRTEEGWSLLSAAEIERKYYDEHGISAEVCFIQTRKSRK